LKPIEWLPHARDPRRALTGEMAALFEFRA
jgi:hypothetical protein